MKQTILELLRIVTQSSMYMDHFITMISVYELLLIETNFCTFSII